MKKGILTSLGLAAVLTLGLASVNEYRDFKEVDAAGTWNLVTDASTLAVGDQVVIAAKDFDYALSVTQNNNNRAQTAITKSGETITIDANVQALTLAEGTSTGSFAFYTGAEGYLYAAGGSSSNYLRTKTTKDANGSFTITISEGVATIKSVGNTSRGWLRYNSTNNPPIFSCYGSGQADIALYKFVGEGGYEVTTTQEIQSKLIKPYYNNGVYTKKTQIYVSDAGKNEIKKSFLGSVQVDRTTYYNGTALLMGDYDGGFDQINSGYGTDAKGNLTHFKLADAANGTITTPTYSANNTHPNWHDKDEKGDNIGEGMEGFYMTLNDMTQENYFEGWSFDGGKATYVTEEEFIDGSNKFVQDFLAFTAPCLQPMVLDATSSNYFQITKLEISEGKHVNWGEYLSLKMYVSSTNESLVINKKDLVLSEARIYTGNQIIDEDVNARIKINQVTGGNVESSLPEKTDNNVNYYKPEGQVITFTISAYENYELTGLTVTNNNEPVEIEFDPTGCEFNVEMNGDVVVTPEFTKVETGDDSGDTLAPITEAKSISFASTAQRTDHSSTRQVWENNGVTLINDKAASTNDVVTNTNPVRLYASSAITIECTGTFNKIVFNCNTTGYATALNNSISDSNCKVTVSSKTVTVVFTKAVSIFEIAKLSAQVRLDSLTVSYE